MQQQVTRSSSRSAVPRTDIQGLRTIAVLSVLVYHVVPERLTGGFVGVDIFFVISGFLITAHLLARPPASVGDFVGFWGRRVRRLLPASLLVLLVTVLATRLVGPETLWENTARQAGAAALYAVNWLLASDAVDYLAAENAATGVQHYWSLSVEEQFYLVWPLLIGLLVWIAARTGVSRRVWLSLGLGAVFVASLLWSIHLTDVQPGAAYFVTPTRMWELAAGGLVALWVPRPDPTTAGRGRAALAWVGVGLMVWAIVTYDGQTPFPSWTAAVPVLGAALVIAAAAGTQIFSPGRWLAWRPVQWVGDISYSLYLWHWPLVILVGARYGELGWLSGSAVVLLSFLLAALTKTFVEDPFRTASWNRRGGSTYAFGVAGMAVVLAASSALWINVQQREEEAERQVAQALNSIDPCLGAGSLHPGRSCEPSDAPVIPGLAAALTDKSAAYDRRPNGNDCWSNEPDYKQIECTFGTGRRRAEADITLWGNSHAGQWLPALQQQAKGRKWRVTTRLASRCAGVGLELAFDNPTSAENCRDWTTDSLDRIIEDRPDLVIMTNRISMGVPGEKRIDSQSEYTAGYTRVLERLAEAGVPVLTLADTPAPSDAGVELIPDCLATHGTEGQDCDGTRADWIRPAKDPVKAAVAAVDSPLVRFADLNDRICGPEECKAVVGGVVVYFDASHLTATYARTLGPALGKAVDESGLLGARS